MKSIIIIITNLRSGGTQKQAVLLANKLSEFNEVTFLILRGHKKEHLFFESLLSQKINKLVLKKNSLLNVLFQLIVCFTRNTFDVCINYFSVSNLLGAIVAKCTNGKIRVINTIRGDAKLNYKYLSIWKFFIDTIWVNSKKIEARLVNDYKMSENQITLNYNIGPVNQFNEVYEKYFLLHVGRINKVKNQLQIVQALSNLKIMNQIELHFVGEVEDSKYYNELLEYTNSVDSKNIHFHSKTSNIEQFYRKAELLILSSISEGMPNVILEAQSFGVPVISSNVGDVVEIIKEGVNGFLYESSSNELSKCIQRYFDLSSEEQYSLRKMSWERLNQYNQENSDYSFITN